MHIKLKEIVLQEAKSSACVKKFGEYLFGEWASWYGKYIEKNTIKEDDIWDLLSLWLRGKWDGKDRPPSLLKAFKELKKCMSSYPDILQPKSNVLYRATYIKNDILNKLLLEENKKYLYTPNSEIQSWTSNETTALYFKSSIKQKIDETRIILRAKFPKSELLFNANFLHDIFQENEVLRISKKPILCDFEIA